MSVHQADGGFNIICVSSLLQVRLRRDPRWELGVGRPAGEALQQHRPRTHHIVRAVAPHQVRVRLRPPGGGLLSALRDLQNR